MFKSKLNKLPQSVNFSPLRSASVLNYDAGAYLLMETTRSAKNTSASLLATRLHHTLITTRPEVERGGEKRGCGQKKDAERVCVFVCAHMHVRVLWSGQQQNKKGESKKCG